MKAQLPAHTTAKALEDYEHVDILWGKDVDKDVIPHVLKTLRRYARQPEQADSEPEANAIDKKHPILNGDGGWSEPEVDSGDGDSR